MAANCAAAALPSPSPTSPCLSCQLAQLLAVLGLPFPFPPGLECPARQCQLMQLLAVLRLLVPFPPDLHPLYKCAAASNAAPLKPRKALCPSNPAFVFSGCNCAAAALARKGLSPSPLILLSCGFVAHTRSCCVCCDCCACSRRSPWCGSWAARTSVPSCRYGFLGWVAAQAVVVLVCAKLLL